jgi:putative membrane protein
MDMKRMVITAGLACAMVLPGLASAQTPTPGGQAGQGSTTSSKPATPGSKQAPGSATGASTLAAADKAFATHAAQGGQAEVELGKVAASTASSPDVKQFGQRMVDDHGKANTELTAWASKSNVTLPTEVDAKAKANHEKLSKMTGAEFDKAYMKNMVADHNKDVAEFERAAKTVKDPDLKAWVEKTLPTLQEHLKMAQSINAKLAGSSATGESATGSTHGSKPGSTTSTPKSSSDKK